MRKKFLDKLFSQQKAPKKKNCVEELKNVQISHIETLSMDQTIGKFSLGHNWLEDEL